MITIVPLLDTHRLPIVDEVYLKKEPKPAKYIVDREGHILMKIQNKLFIFNKNGQFVCQIIFEGEADDLDTLDIKAISPNGQFMVYEIRSDSLYRDRTKELQEEEECSAPSIEETDGKAN